MSNRMQFVYRSATDLTIFIYLLSRNLLSRLRSETFLKKFFYKISIYALDINTISCKVGYDFLLSSLTYYRILECSNAPPRRYKGSAEWELPVGRKREIPVGLKPIISARDTLMF